MLGQQKVGNYWSRLAAVLWYRNSFKSFLNNTLKLWGSLLTTVWHSEWMIEYYSRIKSRCGILEYRPEIKITETRSIPCKMKGQSLSIRIFYSVSQTQFCMFLTLGRTGFGGLLVSMMASGTPSSRVQTRPKSLDFSGIWKILRMTSFGGEVKESVPVTAVNYECASKIPCIVPSFASRGLSCLCGAWCLWRWMRGTHWGQGYNRPTGRSAEKSPHETFNFLH